MPVRPAAKSTRTRAYKFGVLKVLIGQDIVMRELELQHELWNQLCMEDGKARKAFNAWLLSKDPDIGPLEAEITLLKAALGQASDSQSTGSALQADRSTRLGQMFDVVTRLRRSVLSGHKEEAAATQRDEKKHFRSIGSQSGLWWCHMEDVLAKFEAARWASIKAGESLWPRRFSGSGTLKARLTSGSKSLQIRDLVEARTKLVHIRQADASELGAFLKGEKGDGGKRAVVTLLVSAEHGEDERNASFLVTLHRPVPANVRVKEVTVTRRAVAASMTRAKWSISLVVEEDAVAITDLAPGELRVVIGVGTDVSPDDGRRIVATGVGDAGALEAVLDKHWTDDIDEAQLQRAQKAEAMAATLQWVSARLHGDLASSADEGVGRLRHLLSGQVALRDLEAALVGLVPSPDGLSSAEVQQLHTEVKHLVALAEKADRLSKKAERYRDGVFRVFAAAVAAQRQAVLVDWLDSAGEGANPSLSILIRFIQEACKRDGLPCRIQKQKAWRARG